MKCDETIASEVPILFGASCPSTITWLVIPIVIDAFKSMISRRFLSHVDTEVLRPTISKPSVADSNSSTAVVFIRLSVFVIASIYHAHICLVFRSIDKIVRAVKMSVRISHARHYTTKESNKQVKGEEIVRAVGKLTEVNRNASPFSFKRKVTNLEIQGQLRSRHPHLKAVALNASQQRLQVALLVEIHYSLRYRSDDMSNVVIMSSPTAVAGFMSNGYETMPLPIVMSESKQGEFKEAYVDKDRYGNLERSLPNSMKVGRNVQRLAVEELTNKAA